MNGLAYHYSKGAHLPEIQRAGILDPRRTVMHGAPIIERPILWFSSDPYWETTVSGIDFSPDGSVRHLTMEESRAAFGTLIRFAFETRRLQPWKGDRLRRKARMSREIAVALEQTAREAGADPTLWYGCFRPIALGELASIEVFEDTGMWVPVELQFDAGMAVDILSNARLPD